MNYREIDLNLLLVLDAMIKERSVTGVSRKLSISQPTASFSLKKLREFAPNASIESVCLDPHDLAQALSDGLVDLSIGYMPELTGSGIYTQMLFEHPFVCLASDSHPLLKDGITLQQYASADHISLVGEGHSQQKFEQMIEAAGIRRRIVLHSQNFMNIPFIVKGSALLATVPKVIAAAFDCMSGLAAFWPPFELPAIPIRQYWHQRMHNDPGQIWLRQTVSKLFLNQDPTIGFMADRTS